MQFLIIHFFIVPSINPPNSSKMKQDFFTHLPTEIITKCVCKPSLDLLESDDFVSFHFSESAPALTVVMRKTDSKRCKVFEFEDELDLDLENPLTEFDFPHGATMHGSANGFLFLQNDEDDPDAFCVYNPITLEFCELPRFQKQLLMDLGPAK